jgi:hypothetical protein
MAGMGRPSKYEERFDDEVRAFMADGYSLAAFAGKIGVSYSTVRLWEQEHPNFSAAVKDGRAGAVYWWEQRGREMAEGKSDGNATSIIFGLKNRAPEEWKDKTEQALTGADGGPVQVQRIERVIVGE